MESITRRDHVVNRSPVPTGTGQIDGQVISAELHAANQRLHARQSAHRNQTTNRGIGGWLQPLRNIEPITAPTPLDHTPQPLKTVALHPSLAIAILKEALAAEARIWLLCKSLDTRGQGWVNVDVVRQSLADKASPLYICGWRRIRQLLQNGKSYFWDRDDQNRIWLYSAKRTARAIGIDQTYGHAVYLHTDEICASLRHFKAHLYTTFHSGRDSMPIARDTIAQLTSVPVRTQRSYDVLLATKRQRNVGIGTAATKNNVQEHYATRPGAFLLTDKHGKQGPRGVRYLAWQLPNSYEQHHQTVSPSKNKRIVRSIRAGQDLAIQREQGNSSVQKNTRLFFVSYCQRLATVNNESYYYDVVTKLWQCAKHR